MEEENTQIILFKDNGTFRALSLFRKPADDYTRAKKINKWWKTEVYEPGISVWWRLRPPIPCHYVCDYKSSLVFQRKS